MPTFNADPVWLSQAIESVRSQLYPHWELCIADDASTDPRIRPLLEQLAQQDTRIKLHLRAQNGHISAASNSALDMATGEWVALLDHDDLLSELALFALHNGSLPSPVYAWSTATKTKLMSMGKGTGLTSSATGTLICSTHTTCSVIWGCTIWNLSDRWAGFRSGFEGSQDYDLALRCVERIRSDQIAHIPKVLYHWRVH